MGQHRLKSEPAMNGTTSLPPAGRTRSSVSLPSDRPEPLPPGPGSGESPVLRRAEGLLEQGDYAGAVRLGYRWAFYDTVRAFGLAVPPYCTDRQFLKTFLRSDMGKVGELLPRLYELYEPVRYGARVEGDLPALRTLLRSLYVDTVLSRVHDPRFQPSGPGDASVWPARKGWSGAGPARPSGPGGSP